MPHSGTTSAGSPYKTSRRVPRPRKDSDSSLASEDSFQSEPRNQGSKYPSATRRPTSSKKSAGDTSPEDGDDEEGEDEDEESDEEPDTVAPFGGPSSKRGHQTGLSLSLTNTSLGKRGRSPASDGNDERPMSKMSRTSEATAETSDDDAAYAALDDDDFSDGDEGDEDDEGEFEQDEEDEIIRGAEDEQAQWADRHGSFSSVDSFFGMLGGVDPGLYPQRPTTFFGEELARVEQSQRRSSMAASTAGETADTDVPVRRVRFADEVTRSSSSTESEDEAPVYPDLFLPQDQLDPGFRRFLEFSNDQQNSDSEDSFSEFANDDRLIEELDDDADSESGSSGYETDEGETTDEDVVPLDRVNPATILRSTSKPRVSQTPASTPIRRRLNIARRGPTMGTFAAVEDKPTIVVDGHGKHMLFYPSLKEQRERKSAQSAPAESSQALGPSQSQNGNGNAADFGFAVSDPMMSTMFSSPAATMVSAFHGSTPQHVPSLSNQIVGPAEAFFPFVQVNKDGTVHMDDEDSFQGISSGDDIDDVVFEQFINTEGHSTEEEDNGEPDEPSSNSTALEEEEDNDKTPQPTTPKFTPTRSREPSTPTPAHQVGSLLSHFDRGVASSFRRNADRHKDWTRSPVNAGIKGGRFDVANSPIAPLRRRRGMSAAAASQLSKSQSFQTTAAIGGHKFPFDGPLRKRIRDANKIKKRRGSN